MYEKTSEPEIGFSFICHSIPFLFPDIRKHGRANIPLSKYKQIMEIIYGTE